MTKCQRIFCIRDTAEDGHGTISIAKATQRKKLAKNVTPSLPVRQTVCGIVLLIISMIICRYVHSSDHWETIVAPAFRMGTH